MAVPPNTTIDFFIDYFDSVARRLIDDIGHTDQNRKFVPYFEQTNIYTDVNYNDKFVLILKYETTIQKDSGLQNYVQIHKVKFLVVKNIELENKQKYLETINTAQLIVNDIFMDMIEQKQTTPNGDYSTWAGFDRNSFQSDNIFDENDFKIKAGENCVGAMGSFNLLTTFYIKKTRVWAS